jgi:hypothetical protein
VGVNPRNAAPASVGMIERLQLFTSCVGVIPCPVRTG